MGEAQRVGSTSPDGDGEAAQAAGRALLERAERDARRIRSDAERYLRQREQEAAMVVAKARRVLMAAEEKAAVIIATARAEVADGTIDLDAVEDAEDIGRVIAPGAARLYQTGHPSRLDRLLASAIGHAVDESFPAEESA